MMNEDPTPPRGEDASAATESDRRRDAQDQLLFDALARGLTYEQAGAVAGVTGRTVARRMARPEFSAEVSRMRGERVAQLTGQLTSLGSDAVEVIRDGLGAGKPADRLRAAQLALTLLVRFRHDTELEHRLAEVERRLDIGPAPSTSAGAEQ